MILIKHNIIETGLWEHNKLHGNESELYKCIECNKSFSSRQGYLIHKRKHNDERPYGCRFCWKAFRDGGTLRKHERIHTGERPHVCPLCNKAFNQKVRKVLLKNEKIYKNNIAINSN